MKPVGDTGGLRVGELFESVYWVADGDGDVFSPHLPSRRYSAIIPAKILGGRVVAYDPNTQSPEAFIKRYQPRVLIFTKAFDGRFVDLAHAAKLMGIKTIATVVDWHFDKDFNLALFKSVDLLVAQTAEMAAVTQEMVGRGAVIVEEPYEGRRNPPRFKPGETLNLLWYGSNHNLDGLKLGLRQIGTLPGYRFRLTVICEEKEHAQKVIDELTAWKSHLTCGVGNWSPELQDQVLEETDIVLIPNAMSPQKRVKGHNRLVAAIHGGRLALASPLPQYLELEDYCWCGENMVDGIVWALENSVDIENRIEKGQVYIDGRFSPQVVAQRWRDTVKALVAGNDPND
ncbi:MAG: hypothetical protein HQ512_07025 [Rhodospirillales bacterium]|nr:hypothetical protein [Rhodospirillales bacterium]